MRTDVASAEMIKLASNAFLSTRISFINEIASVCELVGADVVDVAAGIGLDHRLGPHFLKAGSASAARVFRRTSRRSSSWRELRLPLPAAGGGDRGQRAQRRRVIQKLQKHLGDLHGKEIAVLGLAFKPGTDDLREAPSLVIAARLLAEGAEVRAWDPVADARSLLPEVTFCSSVLDAVRDADAAVIVTEWPEVARSRRRRHTRPCARRSSSTGETSSIPRQCGRSASSTRASDGPCRSKSKRASPMEAIILAGGKAERLGDAAGGKPKALVPVAGRPLAAYQVAALAGAGVDHVIVSCAAGAGAEFEQALAGLGVDVTVVEEPEPLGRGGGLRFAAAARREEGDVYALNGDELLALDLAALLAGTGRPARPRRSPSRSPPSSFGVVELDGGDGHGLRRGRRRPLLGQLRRLRAGCRGGGGAARARRPRDEHVPAARRRRDGWPPIATTASGSPSTRRRTSVGPRSTWRRTLTGCRVTDCAFEPRRVDKPWGWELIWALTERYCGKLLFVRAGESLSLQYHEAKDESWYVQEGRAELELSAVGDADREQVEIRAGDCFRFRPQTVHRLRAIEDTLMIEVSTPEIDDVVRLEDAYGREGTSRTLT